jgi:hypothetical protein
MSRRSKDLMHQVTPCTARKRNGDPCGNAAMNGSTVCRMHGGAAPQVKRRAQQRILEASDKAAAHLVAMMQDKTIPPAVQLAAARDLLDRAGLAGKQELELSANVSVSVWDNIEGILIDVEEEGDDFDKSPDDPNVIDAEVVEDDAAEAARDAAMLARQAERDRAKRRTGRSVPPNATRAETDDPGEGYQRSAPPRQGTRSTRARISRPRRG